MTFAKLWRSIAVNKYHSIWNPVTQHWMIISYQHLDKIVKFKGFVVLCAIIPEGALLSNYHILDWVPKIRDVNCVSCLHLKWKLSRKLKPSHLT